MGDCVYSNNQSLELSREMAAKMNTKKPSFVLRERMQEAAYLADELKFVVHEYGTTLAKEGIHGQLEILKGWAESYRQGLAAANAVFHIDHAWLEDLSAHLSRASKDIGRREKEGADLHACARSRIAVDYLGEIIFDVKEIFARS